MADAENQTAVSGACALKILQELSTERGYDDDIEAREDTQPGQSITLPANDSNSVTSFTLDSTSSPFRLRTFSLTTEGPMQNLWAHLPRPCTDETGSTHGWAMVYLESFRITSRKSAVKLVGLLAVILAWGANEFKEWVLQQVVRFLRAQVSRVGAAEVE